MCATSFRKSIRVEPAVLHRRGYFGATEALPIQYFTFRAAGNDRALIDNLAYRPIPSTALLSGLGLLGLTLIGSKSRE